MGDGNGAKWGAAARRIGPPVAADFSLTNNSLLEGKEKTRRQKNEQKLRAGFMKSVSRFLSRHLRNANEFVDPVLVVPTGRQLHYSEIFRSKNLLSNAELSDAAILMKALNPATDQAGLHAKLENLGLKDPTVAATCKNSSVRKDEHLMQKHQLCSLEDSVDVEQNASFFNVEGRPSLQLRTVPGSQSLSVKQKNPIVAAEKQVLESCKTQNHGTDAMQERKNDVQLKVAENSMEEKTTKMGNHAVAGALAGVIVSLCLHPLDTIKTVIQSKNTARQALLPTVASIISARGVSGLYRGLGSNLASSAPISAIYAFTYESVKATLLPRLPEEYHSLAYCAAGGCASVATSLVYTPSERVKQQMQVGAVYRNSWLALVGILQRGGLPALYAGWEAVLCRNVPQSVIKFFTYEALKHWALRDLPPQTHLTNLQTLAFGGLAGSTAALFTTPFDVVKTRLQTQTVGSPHHYTSVLNALHTITAEEGVRSLYRGLIPRLAIYVSQGALFFASYEFCKRTLAVATNESQQIAVAKQSEARMPRRTVVTPA